MIRGGGVGGVGGRCRITTGGGGTGAGAWRSYMCTNINLMLLFFY